MAKVKKAKRKTVELTLTLVGLRYRMDKQEIEQLKNIVEDEGGISCKFEPEPDNEVDPKAVKVIALDLERRVFTGRHLGYVQRPASESLFKVLKAGATIKICLLDFVDDKDGTGEIQVALVKPQV